MFPKRLIGPISPIGPIAGGLLLCAALAAAGAADTGRLDITVSNPATPGAVAARIHLKDAAGRPQRAPGLPFWRDHFVSRDPVRFDLPAGTYAYEIERGPEFARSTGTIEVKPGTTAELSVRLVRLADMAKEGWWSGELHVHRAPEEIELHMLAEDLHVAPVITWWNNRNAWADAPLPADPLKKFKGPRFANILAGEDEREGGALLFFHLPRPLPVAGSSREYPSPMTFVEQARKREGVWIDVEKPFWWDVPIWLASGQIDSIGLANNHMCRDRMYESEAWGKPRDTKRLPPPQGNGYWSQEIYYHLLNCGMRVPPSAGSASGVLPNPVGYNRVYVHLGPDFDYDKWWAGLRAGRSFVTNGPLLRVTADGQLPGHFFTAPSNRELTLDLKARLTTRDPIRFVEVIKNGRIERRVPYDEWERTGSLGKLAFRDSGWFLVRAIADVPETFRFASTAPFFVEIGDAKRRVSKSSALFFLEWVRERIGRVKVDDATRREEVLKYHRRAEEFWRDLVGKANAE